MDERDMERTPCGRHLAQTWRYVQALEFRISGLKDERDHLRNELARLEGQTNGWPTEDELSPEMRARLMPEGMEWPRFEDGRYVTVGELWVDEDGDVCEVRSLEVSADGKFDIYDEDDDSQTFLPGARVRRPEQLLGADGNPIEVGETVYDISDGKPLLVVSLGEGLKRNGCNVLVRDESTGQEWRHFNTCLTHERPEGGAKPPATASQGCRDTVAPDSWGRWKMDALLRDESYCEQRGIEFANALEAANRRVEDMMRRAQALAEGPDVVRPGEVV